MSHRTLLGLSLLLAPGCLSGGSKDSDTLFGAAGADGCGAPEATLAELREKYGSVEAYYHCSDLRQLTLEAEVSDEDPVQASLNFITDWAKLVPLVDPSAEPRDQLRTARVSIDEEIAGYHVTLDQHLDGVAVPGAQIVVHIANNSIVGLDVGDVPRIDAPDGFAVKDPAEVTRIAANALGAGWRLVGTPRLTVEGQRVVWVTAAAKLEDEVFVATVGRATVDAETGSYVGFEALKEVEASPDVDIRDGTNSGAWRCYATLLGNTVCDEGGCDSGASSDARDLRAGLMDWHGWQDRDNIREGWDDSNGQMIGVADADFDSVNASYNSWCDQVRFATGVVIDDIVGHEASHAVDEHTAQLRYSGQPGAIDEHLADFRGEAHEREVTGSNDWLIGVGWPGGHLRDFADPTTQGDPRRMSRYRACSATTCPNNDEDDYDSIDVHTNSGILNHMAYLLSEGGTHADTGITVKGIGFDQTHAIIETVHTRWLSEGSDFGHYRGSMLNAVRQASGSQAAKDRVSCAIRNAWAAVEIGVADQDCDGVLDPDDDDSDNDGVRDGLDNCPKTTNAGQGDLDADGTGDACDEDLDGDGVGNGDDTCPATADPKQDDGDNDGVGDACDDRDRDGLLDIDDNCPDDDNPDQADMDRDRTGDACDDDIDNDGVKNGSDNCPTVSNRTQTDSDRDGVGDTCQDDDGDGYYNHRDNCPQTNNPGQGDFDRDSLGDACDDDRDGDGLDNEEDLCPYDPSADGEQHSDEDEDGYGDICDPCPEEPNPAGFFSCKADRDGDGIPDYAEYDWRDLEAAVLSELIIHIQDYERIFHPFEAKGVAPLPICTEDCPDWLSDADQMAIETSMEIPHSLLVLDERGHVVARSAPSALNEEEGYRNTVAFTPAADATAWTWGDQESPITTSRYFLSVVATDPKNLGREALAEISVERTW